MARIFLSHSSANDGEAAVLRDWLIGEGWDDLFLDLDPTRGIAAGERWELALNEAANRCEAVLFLVSRAWLGSRWCLKELSLATKLNKRIFGVLIEDIPIAELPVELTATHQLVDLAAGSDHVMLAGHGTGGAEVRATFSRSGLTKLRTGLMRAGLDARFFAWPPEHDPDRSPYRGLKPLEADDAGIFLGREAQIIAALDGLRGMAEAAPPRLMAILGASGAGKSSFLRAGLVPRLVRDDRNFLMLPIVRPERTALHGEAGLVRCLETAAKDLRLGKSRAAIKAAVEAGADAVGMLLAELAEAARVPDADADDAGRPPRVVLAVDQGEELFLTEGCEEAEAFLNLLRDLATSQRSNLMVLFTIRSDSFEQLQTAPEIDGLSLQTFNLPPMPRGAYQTVIEGPAKRLADGDRMLNIEPALTAALLVDIEEGGGKDALPLLAFTLERLYEEYGTGGKATLTLAQYQALGGVRGSIEAAVKDALAKADSDPKVPRDEAARLALLRRALIPWVAGIDPETGAPRRRVARLSEIPPEARPLVDHLIDVRLLSTDVASDTGETTVEPAHEALLRQWGLLQGWLEEDFAALAALEGIRRAARDWAANDRDGAWLSHTGGRLEDAETVARREDFAGMLEPTDRDYLGAAHAAETARRDHELAEARKLAAAQKDAADRQRQVAQRTRLGLIAASLLLVVAVGTAVFGFDQAREAQHQAEEARVQKLAAEQSTREALDQQARAQRALETATKAANTLVFDVVQKFRYASDVPAYLMQSILQPTLKLQNDLIAAGEDDPDLLRSQSVALNETVNTLLTVGDTSGALTAATKSRDIMVALLEKESDNLLWKRDLSVSLNKIGDVKLQAGDQAGALAAYEESLVMARDLAAETSTAQTQRDLSVSLNNIGDMKAKAGDNDGAMAAYQEALDIARELAKDTDDAGAQRDLTVSLNNIADMKLEAGDRAGALELYEQALTIRRELAKDTSNAEAQRDVAASLNRIGGAKQRSGDQAGALAAYEEGLQISREQARDKSNAQAQRGLSVNLTNIGDAKLKTGDKAGALAAYEESLKIDREIARDTSNAQAQRDLAISLNKMGDMKVEAGDQAGAMAAYEESLSIRRGLAGDKSNPQAQRDLSFGLSKIGKVKLEAGDRTGAIAAYEENLGVDREIARDKSNADAQRNLSFDLTEMGDMKLDGGDEAGAMAAYEEGLAIDRDLARDKTNARAQRDLSISLAKVGNLKSDDGDPNGALVLYQEGVGIARELATDKSDAEAQRDLSLALNRVGDAKRDAGDPEGALAAYEEGLGIRRALAGDKDNSKAQRDLSISLARIGDVKSDSGDQTGALTAYEEVVSVDRALATDKSDAQAQRDLSFDLTKLGELKATADDRTGALAAYEESLGIDRELASDKSNGEAQRDLAISLANVGNMKREADDQAGALAAYEESLALRRVLARDRGNSQAQRDLSFGLTKTADMKAEAGDQAGALAAYEESVGIDRELAKNGGGAGARRDVSVGLNRVGDLKLDAGDKAGALAAYDESLGLARALAADKGNVLAQTDLVVSLTKVASVSGDAKPYYLEARDVLHALDADGRLPEDKQGWVAWLNERLDPAPAATPVGAGTQ